MTESSANTRERLRAVVLGRLESLQRAGVMQLPRAVSEPTSAQPPTPAVQNASPVEAAAPGPEMPKTTMEEEPMAPKQSSWQTAGGSTLFERMANLSRGTKSDDEDEDDDSDEGSSISIPRFLGRQNNQ